MRFSITQSVAAFFVALTLLVGTLCGFGIYRLYKIDAEFDRSRRRKLPPIG